MLKFLFTIGLCLLNRASSLSMDQNNLAASSKTGSTNGFAIQSADKLPNSNSNSNNNNNDSEASPLMSRRSLAQKVAAVSLSLAAGSIAPFLGPQPAVAAEASNNLAELKAAIVQARGQLDLIPDIIENQKWDKVRAVLITPPISDFWTTTRKGSNVLLDTADAVGVAGGDEFNVLEFREEAQSHLRYLDMAVYNNIFNPIATEGTAGATKELVRSYYEDPTTELKACKAALDGILKEIASTGK